jgi:hypothetical protein
MAAFAAVEDLQLGGNRLGDAGVAVIVRLLYRHQCQNLRHISLGGNRISGAFCLVLYWTLAQRWPGLQLDMQRRAQRLERVLPYMRCVPDARMLSALSSIRFCYRLLRKVPALAACAACSVPQECLMLVMAERGRIRGPKSLVSTCASAVLVCTTGRAVHMTISGINFLQWILLL